MNNMPKEILLFVGIMIFVLIAVQLVFFVLLARPWLRAFLYRTPVSLVVIVMMRLRGNPPMLLVDAYITLKRSGSPATITDVELTYVDNKTDVLSSDDLVELVKKNTPTD